MIKFLFRLNFIALFSCCLVSGCVQPKPQTKEDIDQKGYVLKPNEGEIIFDDEMLLVKASPKSGTQGSVMVYDEMPKNGTSGIHYHVESDEFFYVLGGKGRILVGEEEKAIETGYFIFVPAGEDHRITSSVDDPLKVIYFVDKPGLAAQFREEGRLQLDRSKMTVEEFNEIVMKYGTVYKTFN